MASENLKSRRFNLNDYMQQTCTMLRVTEAGSPRDKLRISRPSTRMQSDGRVASLPSRQTRWRASGSCTRVSLSTKPIFRIGKRHGRPDLTKKQPKSLTRTMLGLSCKSVPLWVPTVFVVISPVSVRRTADPFCIVLSLTILHCSYTFD